LPDIVFWVKREAAGVEVTTRRLIAQICQVEDVYIHLNPGISGKLQRSV
jgi:hypothetical protein